MATNHQAYQLMHRPQLKLPEIGKMAVSQVLKAAMAILSVIISLKRFKGPALKLRDRAPMKQINNLQVNRLQPINQRLLSTKHQFS